MEMNEKIKISLLGKFEIQNGDAKIEETVNRSKKMWNLLGYIITHHDKQISQAEYIEMLWPEDKSSNPINALKTLLSRLRAFLEPIAIHDENFILSSQGSYHWNDKLNYVIDTDLFEMYIKKASNTDCTVEERISLYEQAIALYKGDFLSKHATELWVIPISTYFHNLYIDSVKELLKLLRERNDFDSMEYYCVNALQIERFDEDLHCILIETYLNQGNTNAALAHYEQTTDFLYQSGAKEVHIRPACPPLLFGCKYLNFSRSSSEMDLITRRVIREIEGDDRNIDLKAYVDPDSAEYNEMVGRICKQLKFTTLRYHRLDDMIESVGIDRSKLCTYCWDGKE